MKKKKMHMTFLSMATDIDSLKLKEKNSMTSKKLNTSQLWYKGAIFYAVIVEVFKDGNSDGIGDFTGLTLKLDYLKDLGITCIWLLPFYPTTGRDNGYDITDYKDVDPRLGTLGEFKTFVKEAHKRDIRVIIDLVVHHTSDKHPWFLEARQDEDSKYRNYYVWTRLVPEGKQQPSAFPGIEAGVWKHDGEAKEFYYHSFYSFEPDLNVANEEVQEEIEGIMDFWMKLGIDGFRMDAATFMFERKGLPGTEVLDPPKLMQRWNTFIKRRSPEAIILAEADVGVDKIGNFFGTGGRMDLLYNFLLNRYIFLSFAKQDATPMSDFIKKLPKPPSTAQWVDFLRNHDELNIEQLDKKDKEVVFKEFAPQEGMRVYDRGIRRRLAPMCQGNLKRLKVAYSLLFSLPGAEMILYGDEIGMGDDLRLPERVAVRTVMQWDNTINGDFSDSHPSTLVREMIAEGEFGYKKINVANQLKDKNSLLNHIKKLISVVKQYEHIAHGSYEVLKTNRKEIFAILYDWHDEQLIILHNLSDKECQVQVELKNFKEFYSNGEYKKETKKNTIILNGFGYRWFKVRR